MVLNPNVLVAESDVAAAIGATLAGTTYTIFGMTLSQADFQSIINNSVAEEVAIVGTAIYNTTDTTLQGVLKSYQINDCAYDIMSGLPGRSATYFNYGVGDERFDLQIGFIHEQSERFRLERDRTLNMVQSILGGGDTVDNVQPSYGQTAAPIY